MTAAFRVSLVRLGAVLAFAVALVAGTLPAAAEKCGAIAFAQSTGSLGWSFNFNTRGEAETSALKECVNRGGNCTVPVWFCNACGAIATTSDRGFGSGWGTTRALAEKFALQSCTQNNPGKKCSIQRWVCTDR